MLVLFYPRGILGAADNLSGAVFGFDGYACQASAVEKAVGARHVLPGVVEGEVTWA